MCRDGGMKQQNYFLSTSFGLKLAGRQAKVVEMHLDGHSYREIAAEIGCSISTVASDIKNVTHKANVHTLHNLETARASDLMRLSKLEKRFYRLAMGYPGKRGEEISPVAAVRMVLKIMQHKEKLLGYALSNSKKSDNGDGAHPRTPVDMSKVSDEQLRELSEALKEKAN